MCGGRPARGPGPPGAAGPSAEERLGPARRGGPELSEWASFFAAGAAKRAAAEAGSTRAVTEREADDLVRDADRFLAVVEQALGLVPHASVA
jgi:HEPN superfamily protein